MSNTTQLVPVETVPCAACGSRILPTVRRRATPQLCMTCGIMREDVGIGTGDVVRPFDAQHGHQLGTVTDLWQDGRELRVLVCWRDQQFARRYGWRVPSSLLHVVTSAARARRAARLQGGNEHCEEC